MSLLSSSSFRFLELPAKIRLIVYEYYCGNLYIESTEDRNFFHYISHTSPTHIEYTSRLVGAEARQYRQSLPVTLVMTYSDTLGINIYRRICFEFEDVDRLSNLTRSKVTTLSFNVKDHIECEMTPWSEVLDYFPDLQRVESIMREDGGQDGREEDSIVTDHSRDWLAADNTLEASARRGLLFT